MQRRFLLLTVLTSAALLLGGCAASDESETTPSSSEDEITTDAVGSKKDLFDQEMLFVKITNWGGNPDDLRNQRDDVRIGDPELSLWKTNARSGEHCPESGNTLIYKTKKFSLRTSGNFTNGTPKSSYKLSLEQKDDRLFGMKALNLKSMWNDVSQMREAIAWEMFEKGGVVASKHTYAKLCVDGQNNGNRFTKYMGLYSLIEQVDKQMLKDHFGKKNDSGNLYKAYHPERDLGPATLGYRSANGDDSGKQYKKESNIDDRTYQLKENEDEATMNTYDDLATFIRVINGVTTPGNDANKFNTADYAKRVEEIFNVKQFLRWAALNSLMGAWDNYWATSANYYVYDSGKKDAAETFMAKPYFTWVPWDYDNSFGTDFHGANWPEANIMDFSKYNGRSSNMDNLAALRHLFKNDGFVKYYLDAIEHFNDTLFTGDKVVATMNKLRPRIEKAAFLEGNFGDPAHTGRQFTNDEVSGNGFQQHELRRGSTFILGIEHFVRIRHDNVKGQLSRIRGDRNMPRGSSGASFPARPEAVPAP